MNKDLTPVERVAWAIFIPPANAAAFLGFTGWIGYCVARKVLHEIWRR